MDSQIVTPKPVKKSISTKLLILILSLIVIVGGTVAGFILVRQNQQIQEKAATPTGTAKVYLTPETKTVNPNQSFSVNVILDTAGRKITAITIDLSYPYTESTPPITATDIQISSSLTIDQSWKFPIKTINTQDGKVQIKIGGLNSSQTGYQTQGEENIATINFKGVSAGTINMSFNPATTKVTSKDSGEDILLTPSSTGTYTVAGATSNPSANPTSSASPSPSASASAVPWTSPTPSPIPAPESGVSLPTTIGIASGMVLLIGSILLVF
jgi:flagellar basal body-associated protein FliL